MTVIETRAKLVSDVEYLIQQQIDEFIRTRQKPKFNLYKYLSSESFNKNDALELEKVTDLHQMKDEMLKAYNYEDEYLVEAYSIYKKNHLREFIELISAFLEDIKTYIKDKSVRIQRKRKVDPTKVASKLKYKPKHTENNTEYTSLPPKDILGKKAVYIYDTAQNKLSVYKGKSLSIKGSTIIGYTDSWSKRLKNINQILDFIVNNPSSSLVNLKDQIRTKEYQPSGRVNGNCLILKVF